MVADNEPGNGLVGSLRLFSIEWRPIIDVFSTPPEELPAALMKSRLTYSTLRIYRYGEFQGGSSRR